LANKKISELNSITNAGLATNDIIPVVDVSGVETKKIPISELDLRYTNEGYVDAGDSATLSSAQSYSDSGISTHSADTTSVHGIADTSALATKTGSEELTNKKLTGGTASSSRVWTPPSDTKANLDSLTRVAGAIYYATDDDLFYKDNGSVLVSLQNKLSLFAKYYCSTNQASSSSQPIDFDTAIYSHASVTTGSSWKFTVPTGYSGYYLIKTNLATQTSQYNTELYYNGSSIGWGMQTINNSEYQSGSNLIFLNDSDYIDIRIVGGSDNILGGSGSYSNIDIIYLG